ncbi:MAG TPA: M23 family metallopeptidase [Thermoleophilaceae bacterium]
MVRATLALLAAAVVLHPVAPAAAPTPSAAAQAAAAKRQHARVVEGFAAPATLEPERFPVLGPIDFGEGDARYGAARSGHVHAGQDVFAPAGTPLVALRGGVVVEVGDDGGRGNYIAVYTPGLHETYLYLHMLRPTSLRPHDQIVVGARVGRVGCTGSCWGDHLHLELRRGRGTLGATRDPLPLLRRLEGK